MVTSERAGDAVARRQGAWRGPNREDSETDEGLLMKPAEAARALRISRSKLYALIDDGAIPVVRLGPRCTRIPRAALRDLTATATVTSVVSERTHEQTRNR